jgi:hypothetical protein
MDKRYLVYRKEWNKKMRKEQKQETTSLGER